MMRSAPFRHHITHMSSLPHYSDDSGSAFHFALLRRLQGSMVSASDDAFLQDFNHYLALLTALAREQYCDPVCFADYNEPFAWIELSTESLCKHKASK